MLRFRCPHCQGKYKVPEHKRGAIIKCPHCSQRLSVPYEGSSYEMPYPDQDGASDDGWPFDEEDVYADEPVITPQMQDTVVEQTGEFESRHAHPGARHAPEQLPPLPDAKTSGMAIASLLLGLLGFTAIVGLILGIMARKKIRASQRKLKGAGLALAGIIISSITLVASIVVVVLIVMAAQTAVETAQDAAEQAVEQVEQSTNAQSDESPADDEPDVEGDAAPMPGR